MTIVSSARDVGVAAEPQLRTGIADAAEMLERHGVASPRHDAESIAAHLLRTQRAQLWRHLGDPIPAGFHDLVARRAARVPLQHITGIAHFRHLTLAVGPGVFIPRPETEVVVDKALSLLDELAVVEPVVVDLCSGSGAIAASIATERTGAVVHAVEIDPGAVPWLRENVAATSVKVHRTSMVGCLPQLTGKVDLVVANPPYIPVGAVPRDLEVARHDPALALYSGVDGLDHIRMVERAAARLLRSDGWVVVEHSDQQGVGAPGVFKASPDWSATAEHVDLTGRDRFLTSRRTNRGDMASRRTNRGDMASRRTNRGDMARESR